MIKIFDVFYNFKNKGSYYMSFPACNCSDQATMLLTFKSENNKMEEAVLECVDGNYFIKNNPTENEKETAILKVFVDQSLESCLDDGVDYKNIKILDYQKTEGALNSILNNLDSVFYHSLGGLNVESRLSISGAT